MTTTENNIDHAVHLFGDLIYDLCLSVLQSPQNAQILFRNIFKAIREQKKANPYEANERAWVLRLACDQLRENAKKFSRSLTPSEQVMLDHHLHGEDRLKQFESYFHRLETVDQLLLLLRDKFGIPFSEISSALALPEGSLKLKRQHALRAIEEWLWEST